MLETPYDGVLGAHAAQTRCYGIGGEEIVPSAPRGLLVEAMGRLAAWALREAAGRPDEPQTGTVRVHLGDEDPVEVVRGRPCLQGWGGQLGPNAPRRFARASFSPRIERRFSM